MKEISADVSLKAREKIQYLFMNFFRGLSVFWRYIPSTYYNPVVIKDGADSPGRKYLHSFLKEKLSSFLPQKEISILDIGCGSGYIRELLAELGYQVHYTGIDIKKSPQFDKYNSHTISSTFVHSSIEEFQSEDKFDFVFSFCVLEHVEDEKKFAMQAKNHTKPEGVQMHIVPSFWTLFLYIFHGYRQYTLTHLVRLFPQKPHAFYRVGGLFSFILHFFYVTIGEYFLKIKGLREKKLYNTLNKFVMRLDRLLPFFSPFYILVLHHKKT